MIRNLLLSLIGVASLVISTFLVLVAAPRYEIVLAECILLAVLSGTCWFVLARGVVWPRNPTLGGSRNYWNNRLGSGFAAIFPEANWRRVLSNAMADVLNQG
jgi:hypothetical protein